MHSISDSRNWPNALILRDACVESRNRPRALYTVGKSNGVMALMDNMVNDLKTEHSESEHEEETAQKDYEDLMQASQKTRSSNAKSITEKESAKSEWTEKIENAKGEHASTTEALAKLAEYISGLRADLLSMLSTDRRLAQIEN